MSCITLHLIHNNNMGIDNGYHLFNIVSVEILNRCNSNLIDRGGTAFVFIHDPI